MKITIKHLLPYTWKNNKPMKCLCFGQVLGDIKHCILATDLALFFGNRARLKEIVQKDEFHWEVDEHRYVSSFISEKGFTIFL